MIQIIDEYVDTAKLPDEDKNDEDGGSQAASQSVAGGPKAADDFADLSLGDGDEDYEDDEEFEEMVRQGEDCDGTYDSD